MTRPAPQHPDAVPDPHVMPPCDREGCREAATVRQGMGGLCSDHFCELYGVTGWQQSTRDHWSA